MNKPNICFADKNKLAQNEYCSKNGIYFQNYFYSKEYENKFFALNAIFKKENINCEVWVGKKVFNV
jgi:hypothetical protein